MIPARSIHNHAIQVPAETKAGRVELWLWVFMMSFALDYRADEARAETGGAGLDQLVFLGLAVISTLAILWHGWRHLLTRPGAWTLLLWSGFLLYMLANSLLQGVVPGHSLRIILPLVLCLCGMMNAHIAGCMGVTPARIVAPVFVAACTNICWRIAQGFLFKGVTLDTVRVEVQSSANNWLAAWIGCCVLLRRGFDWRLLIGCGVLFTGIFITVTRSLLFPVFASAMAVSICYLIGTTWGLFKLFELPRRLMPVGVAAGLILLGAVAMFVIEPTLVERWDERLFHHASDRNVASDISYLTRRAEADAILHILNKDPVHFVNGKGIGATYYWDPAYMPEIHLVYPPEMELGHEVWFAGHSLWTYSLFSGGVIGVCAFLLLLGGTMIASLRGARANATDPGPDQWLAFLPFVAVLCLASESFTSNPFDERLASIIFGIMAGLPQAFMVRASWIHATRQTSFVPFR
ncbi:hypothetical protein KBB96_12045 [Luteolibacter ambystomatis]|uniref:O-antigen ligase family protein n=1 Tax=Luteolibacter ambystomatis TaxID=2824561 RepID=A0A975IY78_9BACT|nr:hypothetical protein [Luteolibacter ambystomatis]QUE49603.1 hypothetical protein KBB96_12045 [Luteolibacter ambystomatis]